MNDFEFLLTAHTNAQQVKASWFAEYREADTKGYPAQSIVDRALEGYTKASAEADLITLQLMEAVASVTASLQARLQPAG